MKISFTKWRSLTQTLLAPFLIASCSADKSDLHLASVKKAEITQRITVSGNVVPNAKSEIIPSYNGYVGKIYVKIGQDIRRGDPIVLITPSLETRTEQFPIRAPFSGRVVQIPRAEGEYVETGSSNSPNKYIVRIDDLSKLFISANVPEVDYPKLKIGQDVVIRISSIPDRQYKGVVRIAALAANDKGDNWSDPTTIQYNTRIEITDRDDQVKPGMTALVDIIPAKKTGALSLPHEYIYVDNDRYYVMLENGKRQDIKVGLQSDDLVEITEGLKEGDRVKQVDFLAMPEHKS